MTDEAVTSEQIQRDLLVLIGLMQQREERMRDTVNQQMQALQVGVQRAGGEVNRVVESAMPRLSQLSQQALAGALDPAAQRLEQSVQNASRTLLAATQNYAQAQQQLAYKASRGMLLATVAVGLAGLLACWQPLRGPGCCCMHARRWPACNRKSTTSRRSITPIG